jgi:hypothetical protein
LLEGSGAPSGNSGGAPNFLIVVGFALQPVLGIGQTLIPAFESLPNRFPTAHGIGLTPGKGEKHKKQMDVFHLAVRLRQTGRLSQVGKPGRGRTEGRNFFIDLLRVFFENTNRFV